MHTVLRSAGRPLDPQVRGYMEPRFGSLFGAAPPAPAARGVQASLQVGPPGDRHEQQADHTARSVAQGSAAPGTRGYDFTRVRIHTDEGAAASAASMQARAYTVGSDIVFGQGQYAPETSEGRRLIAHELTHVVQQGSASVQPRVQRDLVYGSGYKSPYRNDASEVASAKADTWYPSSTDFAATASGSGGGTGAAKFDDLLNYIKGTSVGSITSLGIVGHSNTSVFALGGKITVSPKDVEFNDADANIDSTAVSSKLPTITGLRDRFAKDAKITLYGCHAGIADSLMQSLADAFQVCVKGFSEEIWWCILWDLATNNIGSRGRTMVDTSGMVAAGLMKKDCATTFDPDVRKLTPDKTKCPTPPASTPPPKKTSEEGPEVATPEMEEP